MRMSKVRQPKRGHQRTARTRFGATAVEFAIVCPFVLVLIFGLLEVSRAVTISDTIKTGIIAGAREAGVAQTDATKVQEEIDFILDVFGVHNRDIVITPEVIDDSTTEVTIEIAAPLNSQNGLFFGTILGSHNLQVSTVIPR